jgi:predicted TIM-barrel fold metal-dependent hydrolase
MDSGLRQALTNYIAGQPVIDCHEHTFLPQALPQPVDLWVLLRNSDVGDDLISAGMPVSTRSTLGWQDASSYLSAVSNTGFYRSLMLAFQNLFDFGEAELTETNWPALSERIQIANARPDWYADVLQQRAGIQLILRVQDDEADPYAVDRRFFAPLVRFDSWILTTEPAGREQLAHSVGENATTLSAYLKALSAAFEQARRRGAVGAKSMLAYHRPIEHTHPRYAEAEGLFNRTDLTEIEIGLLQDFMAHAVAEQAGIFDLPYQIHVGYGSWQSNITRQANPLLLNSLIEAHRQTKFVLLHGSYPFIGEMGTLAKNHPNVFIETGWLAYIASSVYRRALAEWLDSVPANKILAFSADCRHIEQTYGTLLLTQQLLAQTLAEKITQDAWSEGLAQTVATRLLYSNAVELYQLNKIL